MMFANLVSGQARIVENKDQNDMVMVDLDDEAVKRFP